MTAAHSCISLSAWLGLSAALTGAIWARRPAGGGYRRGAGAQEENLFRRSNYVQFLDTFEGNANPPEYPLDTFGERNAVLAGLAAQLDRTAPAPAQAGSTRHRSPSSEARRRRATRSS
jgi:hypothetical protein